MQRADHRIFWKRLKGEEVLNEGLIKSWEKDQFIKFLSKLLDKHGFKYDVDEGDDYQSVFLKIFDLYKVLPDVKEKFYKDVEILLNQSGYFPIYKEFNIDDFVKSNALVYKTEFARKFNVEKRVPRHLYHVTHPQFLNSILKKGLIPKSKKLIEPHPDRVYFTGSFKGAKEFAEEKYAITEIEDYNEYVILKINTSGLDLKLYVDPLKIPGINMLYTLDNIPPSAIEVVSEGRVNENKIVTKFRNFK